MQNKYQELVALLSSKGSAAVAFSGGVDSALLLFAAVEALGDEAVAVLVESPALPDREAQAARCVAAQIGARLQVLSFDPFRVPEFVQNASDRCYACKRKLLGKVCSYARECGLSVVVEGSNVDDRGDYRPGARAIAELGVESPLQQVGLTKREIRALAKSFGLAVHGKPSFSCLATRFPTGETLTPEALDKVGRAEQLLLDEGFSAVRVRSHGSIARIEVDAAQIGRWGDDALRNKAVHVIRELGWRYVTLDLEGFRTGSMNDGEEDTA